jgi:DNA-binding NtrC family response regulator
MSANEMDAMTPMNDEPITILFVDDEPAVLRLIRRALVAEPFQVLTVTRASHALDVLRTHHVDVLVSDVEMPEMGGLELLRVVRRDFPSTLRILLSGGATVERALSAINDGEVTRFFAKPFHADVFRAAIGELVGRIRKLREERATEARAQRRDAFLGWVDESFPGTLRVEWDADHAVLVDLDALRVHLGAANLCASSLLGES